MERFILEDHMMSLIIVTNNGAQDSAIKVHFLVIEHNSVYSIQDTYHNTPLSLPFVLSTVLNWIPYEPIPS